MKRLTILAMVLMAFTAASHAATAWKIDETYDEDGDKVCVYKYGFKKVYQAPDFGSMCSMTIEVNDD